MNMKKRLSLLLVLALLLGIVPMTAFASSPVYYLEGHCSCIHPPRTATVGPVLAEGNHERYVDRLAALPEYALEYYSWLEDNAGLDGALVDPTVASYLDGGYYHSVTEIEGSKQFTFTNKANLLNTAEQIAAAAMDAEFNAFMAYTGAVWDAFGRDHTEVFWLSGQASYSYFGEYYYSTRGNVATVTYKADMVTWLQQPGFDIRDAKYSNPKAVATAVASRDKAVDEILKGCSGLAPHEQVAYLNDALTARNAYNSIVATGITEGVDEDAWKCISALEGRSGKVGPVCEGYARAFKVLCDELDIPCVLVDGVAKGDQDEKPGGHMWNYVQLDGGWYAVDVTWNDPYVSSRPTQKVSGHENQKWLLLGSDTQVASGLKFLDSHEMENRPSIGGLAFVNGPVLEKNTYDPNAVAKFNLTGTVKSTGNEEVTVQLWQGNTLKGTCTLSGNNGTYCFEDLLAGDYRLTFSKPGHVTRTQELTVTDHAVTQDTKLSMPGDVSGDGRLNMGDVGNIYGYVRKTASITDPYILQCADLTGDGRINMGDVGRLYDLIRS